MKDIITDSDLKVGIIKCIENAESLIRDAEILKAHQSIERAYTLFQLSLEEIGKAAIVFFYAILSDKEKLIKLSSFKKEFHSHKLKTTQAINFDYLILSSINEKGERQKFFKVMMLEHEKIEDFNNLKNYSLYTSIFNSKFLKPADIITLEHLEGIKERAKTRFGLVKPYLEFSLKHFEKVKKAGMEADNEQIGIWAAEYINDLLTE